MDVLFFLLVTGGITYGGVRLLRRVWRHEGWGSAPRADKPIRSAKERSRIAAAFDAIVEPLRKKDG